MNKRQAKKKRSNRLRTLFIEYKKLYRMMAKCYKPRPRELEIHSCFLPMEYVIDKENKDDRE